MESLLPFSRRELLSWFYLTELEATFFTLDQIHPASAVSRQYGWALMVSKYNFPTQHAIMATVSLTRRRHNWSKVFIELLGIAWWPWISSWEKTPFFSCFLSLFIFSLTGESKEYQQQALNHPVDYFRTTVEQIFSQMCNAELWLQAQNCSQFLLLNLHSFFTILTQPVFLTCIILQLFDFFYICISLLMTLFHSQHGSG